MSDAYGRMLVLRIGLIGFGIASIAIAAAPNPEVLIAARAVQGAAGAFLVPSSLALDHVDVLAVRRRAGRSASGPP